jgi:hypothetical protein
MDRWIIDCALPLGNASRLVVTDLQSVCEGVTAS